jgi:ribonuclease BN (tRNA processing enzyme)
VVEVVVLGSGTGVPHPRRGSPGTALIGEGELAVVDLGPGALRALVRASLDHSRLRRVFFTHFHPDHVGDLVALLFASRHRREGTLQVLGPVGLGDLVRGFEGMFGRWIQPAGYELTITELEEGEHRIGPWLVAARRVPHTPHSLAYRFDAAGATVAITGDTSFDGALVELARDADLLVAECSYPNELAMEGHLSPASVGRLAREANVREVLLVHMYPETESFDLSGECAREYRGKVTVGHDLLRMQVGA